jgi:transcriptional regulator of acetoin/glycerol metabolism
MGLIGETESEPQIVSDAEMKKREKENLIAALQKCTWKIYGDDGAAKLLGIKPTTLSARIKKFGIQKPG